MVPGVGRGVLTGSVGAGTSGDSCLWALWPRGPSASELEVGRPLLAMASSSAPSVSLSPNSQKVLWSCLLEDFSVPGPAPPTPRHIPPVRRPRPHIPRRHEQTEGGDPASWP